jgi:pimeloyl-ACP methyl ester carboxylesterase
VLAPSLAYERRGLGPPLVLLHPLGADRHVWDPVLDRLARERDVIAPDLPGFGGSPSLALADGQTPTPERLAVAVRRFVETELDLDGTPGMLPATRSAAGLRWRSRSMVRSPRSPRSLPPACGRGRWGPSQVLRVVPRVSWRRSSGWRPAARACEA